MNEIALMSPLRAKPYGLYTRQVGYLGLQGRYLGMEAAGEVLEYMTSLRQMQS